MKQIALLTLIGAVVLALLAAGVGVSAGHAAEAAMTHHVGMTSAPDALARQFVPAATPVQGAGRGEPRKVEAVVDESLPQQEVAAAALRSLPSPTPTAWSVVDPGEVQLQAGIDSLQDTVSPLQFTSCASVDGVSQTECEALVALYNNTNGSAWLNRANWLETDRPCEWYGVSCSPDGVTGLFLYANQLSGSLPSQLGNLGNLQYLWLHNNALVGTIPAVLGNLSNLRILYLFENQLSGTIPIALGNLSNLQELSIYNNQFSGTIPVALTTLANLQQLRLDGNQLTGGIPAEFGSMPNLIGLELLSNQLTGSIPVELGNLANLQWLRLDNNQLTGGIPPQLGNLSTLRNLSLSNNPLGGQIPVELGNLSQLRELLLSNNQLSGPIPATLGNPSGLQILDMSNNQLSGSIPEQLGNLTQLQRLWLYNNQLSGAIPTTLGNLVNLQYLALSTNQLSGSIPLELGNLNALLVLSLNENQLSGAVPEQLGNLTQLQELWLYNNQLSGPIPTTLGNLANLRYLALSTNQLSGAIPVELGNLSNLLRLWFYENQLSGAIPASFGNLSNLELLNLHNNQLSGSIPEQLGALSQLQILWLSRNQLSGSIPTTLGSLPNLRTLSLWNNRLSGQIPVELGNLSTLEYLDLDDNQLTGAIPPALGNLVNLRTLWLSRNQLTGAIPPEMGNLNNLIYLYLHENGFRGALPDSMAALTALQHFYFYNTQLCVPDTPAIQNWLAAIPNVNGTDYNCSEMAPGVAMTKLTNDVAAPPGPYLNVGAPVTWTYVVTNTGGVALVEMSLVDDIEGQITICAPFSLQNELPPGESTLCTQSGAVSPGEYSNTALFTAMPAMIFTEPVTASASSSYVGAVPGVTLTKYTNGQQASQAPGPFLRVGDTVEWTYIVTNTGNSPLTDLELVDEQEGPITSCAPSLAAPLAAGGSLVCTKVGVVQPGQYSNTAVINGAASATDAIAVSAADQSYYFGVRAQLTIDKTTQGQNPTAPPGPVLLSGSLVSWAYIVRNPGETPVLNVALVDDREGMITECSPIQLPATLQPGAATVCAKTGIAQVGQYANTATVSGIAVSPDGEAWQISTSDTSYYFGRGGEVQLTKQTNGQNADQPPGLYLSIGESVTWSYRITNTGHVALTNLSLFDDREGTISSCTPSLALGLAPGASISCTKSGVTQRGQYTNTATFVGQSASGPAHQVQATATNYYFGSNSEMAKSVFPSYANVGDELTFTLVVTSRVPDRSTTFYIVEQLPPPFELIHESISTSSGSAWPDFSGDSILWYHTGSAGASVMATLTYRARLQSSCFIEATTVAEIFEETDSFPLGRAEATVYPANGTYCAVHLPMIEKAPPPDPLPVLANGFLDESPKGAGWIQLIDGQPGQLVFAKGEGSLDVDPQTSPFLAWLGGKNSQTNQLKQRLSMSVPRQYDAYLQFWYYIASVEPFCGNDRAEVRVGVGPSLSPADAQTRIDLCTATNTNQRWVLHPPIPLSAFRGQTVELEFHSNLDAQRLSNFFVDSIKICSNVFPPFCE